LLFQADHFTRAYLFIAQTHYSCSGSSFLAWPQRRTFQKRIAATNRQKTQGLAVCTVKKKSKFQSYGRKIIKLALLRRASNSMIFFSSQRLKFLTLFLQGHT